MLRLYKKEGSALRYWEAWVHETEFTVHWGTVGEMGESRTQPLPSDEDPDMVVASEAADWVDQGYDEPDPDSMVPLIIQYPIEGKGTGHDFEKRNAVEDLCTDILGWTGNGEVEHSETQPGRMNVYLRVMDPEVAVRTLVDALDEDDLLEGAILAIAHEEEPAKVLWPQGHPGLFQV